MNTKNLRQYTLFILLCGLVCAVSVKAQRDTFRVTLNGYMVNQQTNEGITTDGIGDELTFVNNVGTVDTSGRLNRISWGGFTSIMNGMQSGHGFPNDTTTPWLRTLPLTVANPSAELFFGEIEQNRSAALILPTIWEWDGVDNLGLMRKYGEQLDIDKEKLVGMVKEMILNPRPLALDKYLRPGSEMGINNTMLLSGGIPQTRPVGMNTTGLNQFGFTPQVLVLTYQAADFISSTNFGHGPGIFPVNYVEAPGMGGNYTLYLQVERNPQSCPNLTSTLNGTAVMILKIPGQKDRTLTQQISLPVEFTDCRRTLRITNFPPITPPEYPTPLGNNITRISLYSGGTGSFNASSGQIELPITLGFVNTNRALGNWTLPLNLRATEGDPLTLVGEGAFSGGYLGSVGATTSVTITGNFSPRPR